jgi:hypothetical protein
MAGAGVAARATGAFVEGVHHADRQAALRAATEESLRRLYMLDRDGGAARRYDPARKNDRHWQWRIEIDIPSDVRETQRLHGCGGPLYFKQNRMSKALFVFPTMYVCEVVTQLCLFFYIKPKD